MIAKILSKMGQTVVAVHNIGVKIAVPDECSIPNTSIRLKKKALLENLSRTQQSTWVGTDLWRVTTDNQPLVGRVHHPPSPI